MPARADCIWIVLRQNLVINQFGLHVFQMCLGLLFGIGDDPDVAVPLFDGRPQHVAERGDRRLGAAARADEIYFRAAIIVQRIELLAEPVVHQRWLVDEVGRQERRGPKRASTSALASGGIASATALNFASHSKVMNRSVVVSGTTRRVYSDGMHFHSWARSSNVFFDFRGCWPGRRPAQRSESLTAIHPIDGRSQCGLRQSLPCSRSVSWPVRALRIRAAVRRILILRRSRCGNDLHERIELRECDDAGSAAGEPFWRVPFEPPHRRPPILGFFRCLLDVAHVRQLGSRFCSMNIGGKLGSCCITSADFGDRAADEIGGRLPVAADG